ncbi:MAG: Dam family site-specific DNA-(adenine-N6)-methyltransferase [Chloroflexi bacterium]|nr:Dam family site-specific DNA-(adenine-N6)-methyltransferase [Chloroflexota bacterium]
MQAEAAPAAAPASPFSSTQPLKPPLKWAGGKRWLVPHLRPLWESFQERRYVEPFCGGLALPLAFMPRHALLNDTNPHLINFYQQVQDGLHPRIEMRNERDLYYQHRDGFNQQVRDGAHDSQQAAARFYYLNRTCYNGLCRFNRKGEFNVPFGSYKTIHYLNRQDFYAYQDTLNRWTFTASDFQDIQLQPDDFVYADPPYDVQFVNYSKHGFSWDDQVRLAHWLADHKGPVVLSNQATDRVIELYRKLNFNLTFLDAPRRISCNGNRTPAKEVLAIRGM